MLLFKMEIRVVKMNTIPQVALIIIALFSKEVAKIISSRAEEG